MAGDTDYHITTRAFGMAAKVIDYASTQQCMICGRQYDGHFIGQALENMIGAGAWCCLIFKPINFAGFDQVCQVICLIYNGFRRPAQIDRINLAGCIQSIDHAKNHRDAANWGQGLARHTGCFGNRIVNSTIGGQDESIKSYEPNVRFAGSGEDI